VKNDQVTTKLLMKSDNVPNWWMRWEIERLSSCPYWIMR